MGKDSASTIACCYPELQEWRKIPLKNVRPGCLVTHFDQQHHRYTYSLLTRKRVFNKATFETIELSLQALRQHLERHNMQELAVPKLGCGYDHLHWQTVFSILSKVVSGSNLSITIFQPAR